MLYVERTLDITDSRLSTSEDGPVVVVVIVAGVVSSEHTPDLPPSRSLTCTYFYEYVCSIHTHTHTHPPSQSPRRDTVVYRRPHFAQPPSCGPDPATRALTAVMRPRAELDGNYLLHGSLTSRPDRHRVRVRVKVRGRHGLTRNRAQWIFITKRQLGRVGGWHSARFGMYFTDDVVVSASQRGRDLADFDLHFG